MHKKKKNVTFIFIFWTSNHFCTILIGFEEENLDKNEKSK